MTSDVNFSAGEFGARVVESIEVVSITIGSVSEIRQSRVDEGSFVSTNSGARIYFLFETGIATPQGEVAADALKVGDLILTVDSGPQPILWTGCQHRRSGIGDDAFKPDRIKAGASGQELPKRALKASKQHRLLLRDQTGEYLGPAVGFCLSKGFRA